MNGIFDIHDVAAEFAGHFWEFWDPDWNKENVPPPVPHEVIFLEDCEGDAVVDVEALRQRKHPAT